MLMRQYEMPWRPAYEAWSAMAWMFTALLCALYVLFVVGSVTAVAMVPAAALVAAVPRLRQGLRVLTLRAALAGRAMEVISSRHLGRLTDDTSALYFGQGFEWMPVHSQRLHELAKVDHRTLHVPPWMSRMLLGAWPQPEAEYGQPYIHGVEPREHALHRPLLNFEGGILLVGTTQCGKGVALSNFLTQAVRRGDVVIFIDPKNSKRLKRVVQQACADYREPDTFLEFHPAFPDVGVRVDFTFNWQKATELASRVESIMPVDKSGAFTSFGWDAVNVVVQGLLSTDERPNLLKLARYIEGGLERVLEESLARYFEATLPPGWRDSDAMRTLMGQASKGGIKRPSEVATDRLLAFVAYYEKHIPEHQRDKVVDSQIRVFRHNRDHYQKITASLLPILQKLTSGHLGRTLSPDPYDVSDRRPIMNIEKIVNGGHVLYMCTDSLADAGVASAIGALGLADLAAYIGMSYNLGMKRRITLVVDEVSEVINKPLIGILNKGAEGGIQSVCAMQTLADLADRLGSVHAARMALGNLNNVFALRSIDGDTQKYLSEKFGRTSVHSVKAGFNLGADMHLGDWSSGKSVQIAETPEDRVPADLLGELPNLQYFAKVAGRLYKGRFQIIDPDPLAPARRAA